MTAFVTLWVPLVETDEECGGVGVYEGTGRSPEHSVGQDRFWLQPVAAEGRPVHHAMSRGDALLLNRWIVHQSMPNRSARTRLSIDFRFFGEHDSSTKHYLDLQRRVVVPPPEQE
jgi:ectoine hydroxylase-related dioxygenase (phytanoyl-CoA dioxygenase family)